MWIEILVTLYVIITVHTLWFTISYPISLEAYIDYGRWYFVWRYGILWFLYWPLIFIAKKRGDLN